jgi:sugar O-acyltransferase (sialic acid O-acetyltransferase NeuD family)
LGHDNYGLAILLDILVAEHGKGLEVHVISNIRESDNPRHGVPFAVKGVDISVVQDKDWHKGRYAQIYISGMATKTRSTIFRYFQQEHAIEVSDLGSLIHPSSILPEEYEMGSGIHVGPGTVMAPYVRVGDLVWINRQSSIGHHTELGELVTINPGVTLAGACRVGKGSTIGAGATVLEEIEIGDNTVVGAGSLVTKSLPANVVAYGVPARIVRDNPAKS